MSNNSSTFHHLHQLPFFQISVHHHDVRVHQPLGQNGRAVVNPHRFLQSPPSSSLGTSTTKSPNHPSFLLLLPSFLPSKMHQRGTVSLPIIVVVCTIGYVYYSTVFIFIHDWFGLTTSQGLINAAVFTAFALMCLSTYILAIAKDPGRIPDTFVPDIEDAENPIHEIKRKGGDLRFCQKCSHYKPPRAHHCRVCKRCVLRMDHHCIWINNCVGHANYKVFFVFVVYAVLACIHSLILLVGSVVHDLPEDENQSDDSLRISYVISGLLLVPVTIALTILLGWHIHLTLRNKTTIEYHEGVRAMWLAKKVGNVYRHPYDLGSYENLTSVLGPSIFTWVCPTSSHIGSGLRFQTAYDNTQ